ncbi:probable DNA-directed RNA polymerase subunit delta [Calliphora vicina]|uniref:probable DNA-directed RNA polymerase subunit delta n=1 Tax=Calliphora vicina TaxID=7373 RepID=UPI00325C24C8
MLIPFNITCKGLSFRFFIFWIIIDSDGNILSEDSAILKSWQEYFTALLNVAEQPVDLAGEINLQRDSSSTYALLSTQEVELANSNNNDNVDDADVSDACTATATATADAAGDDEDDNWAFTMSDRNVLQFIF